MLPEFTMNAKKIASMNLSDETKRLERFLKSLDSHKYHRILGDAATHPFYLNPDKMYTIRELNRVDDLCESDTRHYTRAQSLNILTDRRDARRKVHA